MATFIGLGPVDPSLLDKGAVLLKHLRELFMNVEVKVDDLPLPSCDRPCRRVEEVISAATGYEGRGGVEVLRGRRQCSVVADEGSFLAVADVEEVSGTARPRRRAS